MKHQVLFSLKNNEKMFMNIVPRSKMTWKQLTERDRREWKLAAIDPHDRDTWRSGGRSAMRAASHLPGRGPLLWIWPLYLHVIRKSDDDDDDDVCCSRD